MEKKIKILIIILGILLFILIILFYPFLDELLINFLEQDKEVYVERIIDGDTIVVSAIGSVRMLGINTPERGEEYYEEAKIFLENLILNQTVRLEFGRDKTDKYKRTLAYVFLGNKNINKQLVENGFANIYFPSGKDTHYNEFLKSWEKCIEKKINLCEFSKDTCAKYVNFRELNVKTQELILGNNCNFNCNLTNWKIKNEGRKNFIFGDFVLGNLKEVSIKIGDGINSSEILYWDKGNYVWTEISDSVFLRDDKNKLVFWESY